MGLGSIFKKAGSVIATPITTVGDAVGLDLSGDKANENLNDYLGSTAAQRAYSKQKQYELLGQLKAPTVSPAQEARLKALEQESTTPLVQDKGFQSNLRAATTGGAAALAGIQNKQVASGAQGGFANQGSISDVYDRVGSKLTEIAQQQNASNEQKRDTVANARQAIADAQIAYENAITQAKIAIESGDSQAAQSALAAAYSARQQIQNNTRQTILGIGGIAAGAAGGGGGGAGKSSAGAYSAPAQQDYSFGQGEQGLPAYASPDYFSSSLGSEPTSYKPHYQTRY